MYPGRAAQLGKRLFEAFDVSCGRLGLDDDDGNVTTAGISPTMPAGPSPPRPELLVTLEARTDAPPRIRRPQIPPLVLLLDAADYEATVHVLGPIGEHDSSDDVRQGLTDSNWVADSTPGWAEGEDLGFDLEDPPQRPRLYVRHGLHALRVDPSGVFSFLEFAVILFSIVSTIASLASAIVPYVIPYIPHFRMPCTGSFLFGLVMLLTLLGLAIPADGLSISKIPGIRNHSQVHSILSRLNLTNTTTDYAMLGISAAMTDQYFVDSGCTWTIVCSTKYMKNLSEIPLLRVKGLSGYKIYNLAGDLHFLINDDNDIQRELIVKAALYDPAGNINLIATDTLNPKP
eukprot:3334510-Rhodomonas_salina.1